SSTPSSRDSTWDGKPAPSPYLHKQLDVTRSANQFDPASPHCYDFCAGWSSLVARWAHNPKVGGSNPPPATKPFNHFQTLESRTWHHLAPKLSVSCCHRRHRQGCQQFPETGSDPSAVLGDDVCVLHRSARIGMAQT